MSSEETESGDVCGALDAYEAAPAVMLALDGDHGGDLVLASANGAARAALGEPCAYGTPASEIAPDVDAASRRVFDDMVGTVLATGRPVSRPGYGVEMNDAQGEPVEGFWDLTVSPWFADDGSVRGVLAHGVDVTDQTRARRARSGALEDVTTVQDALLPDWLPVLPGVEVAGRYLLAHHEPQAGGDWYDALGLPDGEVALIVGDIAGHGVAASAAMGRLRAVAQERLVSGAGLEATIRALDTAARNDPEARAATVCIVLVDPATGHLEYCTAGHPPPLVVRPRQRQSRFLPHTGASPLATTGDMSVERDQVERGDLVVLYTDGLLSRPGRGPAIGTVELGQVAADAAAVPAGGGGPGVRDRGPADRVCEQALGVMTRATGYDDDIAVLVAEVTEPTAPLHVEVAADRDSVSRVIDALAAWLESMRVRDLDHVVVQHAVDELVTNAVEHAYTARTGAGSVVVDADLLGTGELRIRFADTGRWATPRVGQPRGRGLTMVRGMVDHFELEDTGEGTVATVRHRLSRPAHILAGRVTSSRGQDPREEFRLTSHGDCLQLSGAMGATGVEDLGRALREAAEVPRVMVDLERVTRLPSSAVGVLHRARHDAVERGRDLVLYAPRGTTAQHVLELVRLPYVTTPVG